jgi:hypothetical protein
MCDKPTQEARRFFPWKQHGEVSDKVADYQSAIQPIANRRYRSSPDWQLEVCCYCESLALNDTLDKVLRPEDATVEQDYYENRQTPLDDPF